MYKLSKVGALVGLLLPGSLLAQSIEGVVVNKQGKTISGAAVTVKGENPQITNTTGRFFFENLSEGKNEIHISASGFSHLTQQVNLDNNIKQLTLTLEHSPFEVIDVVATPIHMSTMESAAPVSVLAGDNLRRQQASTLGDTLEKVAGVHTNFHANVASTPIIRGLSGPRVLIAQNGLDVSDVSRVGPDHSVASEASTAQQIEVLRGPATLFYGSGAIGGVVNVVDNRVPTDNTSRAEWLVETASVNDQKLASFNVTTGIDNFAFYADGHWRDADDYEVPVAPEKGKDHNGVVENSAEESYGFTLGTSYLFDKGYFGVSVEQFNREYGIPGHTHGSDEEHSDHEEIVFADLEQTRVQLLGEYRLDGKWLDKLKFQSGFTDYDHAEIEQNVAGTLFKNDTHELRVDLLHSTFDDWNGGISVHYKQSDVEAQGEEAFTPPSDTEMIALAIMEEKHFGDVLVQLGARIERVTINANNVLLPSLAAHAHEEEDDHEHHQDEAEHQGADITRIFDVKHEFTPVSVSAGLVWDFTPGYNLGLSVSRSERALSATELLSFGPHIGTRTYEVGALFSLFEEEGSSTISLNQEPIDLETANNIDLTFRKTQGDIAFVFNAFYNQVDNYYYQINTGLFAEDGHDHDHGDVHEDEHDHDEHSDEGHDEHSGELPVYLFQSDDVILHGFEAQIAWQVTDEFKATFFSDYVRARLDDGGDLPRIPPMRFGGQFAYKSESFSTHLDITRYQEQDKVAPTETSTDGYTLVDASISYDLSLFDLDGEVYLKGTNLTDTEARVHSSFLKNIAPRPGRNIAFGIKGYF